MLGVLRRSEEVVPDIATTIRRYILDHPDAADTIEGISHWWLPHPHEAPQGQVEDAVAHLVKEGVLKQIVLEDGRVIYASARKR
jgi:hypothetical protein